MDAVGVKTLQQTVLDFDKCDVQVLLAAMTSMCNGRREGGREGEREREGGSGRVEHWELEVGGEGGDVDGRAWVWNCRGRRVGGG